MPLFVAIQQKCRGPRSLEQYFVYFCLEISNTIPFPLLSFSLSHLLNKQLLLYRQRSGLVGPEGAAQLLMALGHSGLTSEASERLVSMLSRSCEGMVTKKELIQYLG